MDFEVLKSEVLVVVLQKPCGLPLTEFAELFHHTHGYPFTPFRYGYFSLQQLLDDMKDVVFVVDHGARGPVIRSRCLSRHVFLLIGENGSIIEGLQPTPADGDQARGWAGFNNQFGREIPQPTMPGHVICSSPCEGAPRETLLKNTPDSLHRPQSRCGSNNPSNHSFGLSNQQSCRQRLGTPFSLNRHPNNQTRSYPPAPVSIPPSMLPAPKKQETSPAPWASKQPPNSPSPLPANWDLPCQETQLAHPTTNQCAPSSLYSSVVSGKTQETPLYSPCTSPPEASSPCAQAPAPFLDPATPKQVSTPLSLTASNFPPLTGESQSAVPKKGSYDRSGSPGAQHCTLQLSRSDFPPLTAESQKAISHNSNANTEHSNSCPWQRRTAQLSPTTADVSSLMQEFQTDITNNSKVVSDPFQSKPEKSTISPELRQNIRRVLEQHPDGLSLPQFKSAYLCTFNHLLPLNGYTSVKDLLAELEDVVKTQGPGAQIMVFPKSSDVTHSGVTKEEFGFSLKEVDPSSIKQDSAGGDAIKANVPQPRNPKPASAQNIYCKGFSPTMSLPPIYRHPAFSMPMHHDATRLHPNYNYMPAVPTFAPCLPAYYRQLPQFTGMGACPPFPGNFSRVGGPFGHGLPRSVPSQPLMYQRPPFVGYSSYTAAPPFAFPTAYAPVTGFSPHPLLYPPRRNSFQASGFSLHSQNSWPSTTQPLQKGIGRQSGALHTSSVSGAAESSIELCCKSSVKQSDEIRPPEQTVPEPKMASLEEPLTTCLDQSKTQPPVQMVLPFTELWESEDLYPESSFQDTSNERLSSSIVDCTGLSDVLLLPIATSSKAEDCNLEGSLSDTSNEEPDSTIMVDPTCRSEASLLTQTASSQIEYLNPEGSTCDPTCYSEIYVLSQSETSSAEDFNPEEITSESLKDKLSCRAMVNTTGESEVSLLHLTELSKSEHLHQEGYLSETSKKNRNSDIEVEPTCYSEISAFPQAEISKADDLHLGNSFSESSNEGPCYKTVVDNTCESVTSALNTTESSNAGELNPEGSLCETSIKETGSRTLPDPARTSAISPLPLVEPSEVEELNSGGFLVSASKDKHSVASLVDPAVNSETSSSENTFSVPLQEAAGTGGPSDVGTAAGCELPRVSASTRLHVKERHTESCRIL